MVPTTRTELGDKTHDVHNNTNPVQKSTDWVLGHGSSRVPMPLADAQVSGGEDQAICALDPRPGRQIQFHF